MGIPEKICDFGKDDYLVKQIYDITREGYIDNNAILDREIKHCKDIYVIRIEGKLVAFTMVNHETIDDMETCYIGLTYAHSEYRGKGYIKVIYETLFSEVDLQEKRIGKKIVCWLTTAVPSIYFLFHENCKNSEPNSEGEVTESGEKIFRKIVNKKYGDLSIDLKEPFILRSVAKSTRYSIEERERQLLAEFGLIIPAFEKYTLDETNGDRFLMIGYARQC